MLAHTLSPQMQPMTPSYRSSNAFRLPLQIGLRRDRGKFGIHRKDNRHRGTLCPRNGRIDPNLSTSLVLWVQLTLVELVRDKVSRHTPLFAQLRISVLEYQ